MSNNTEPFSRYKTLAEAQVALRGGLYNGKSYQELARMLENEFCLKTGLRIEDCECWREEMEQPE